MNTLSTQDQKFVTQCKELFLNNIHGIEMIISSITNEVKISDDFIKILLLNAYNYKTLDCKSQAFITYALF